MEEVKELLGSLGLLEIDGYKFSKKLSGGSALSSLYVKNDEKVVFKFLIAPRNCIELERFKLEFSVLNNNKVNFLYNERRMFLFLGPEASYPLPRIKCELRSKFSDLVNYFAYAYEDGELLPSLTSKLESSEDKILLLYRLSSGLNYFNQVGYSHRDLHPSNILLLDGFQMTKDRSQENDPRVKFLDMGNCQKNRENSDIIPLERDLDEDAVFKDNNRRILASFVSMPPDFLRKGEFTKNYDSWSFGIYAYQLLFGETPFEANQIGDITSLLETREFHENYEINLNSLSVGMKLVLKHLLSPDGESRPSIDTIVRLFHWLVNENKRFQNSIFIKEVIHNDGFDPYHNPIDDYY